MHDFKNVRTSYVVGPFSTKVDGDCLPGDDGDVAYVASVAPGQRLKDEDHLQIDNGRVEIGRH